MSSELLVGKGGEVKMSMSFLNTVRFLFILVSTVFGLVMCEHILPDSSPRTHVMWALGGFLVSAFFVFIEVQVRRAHPKELVIGMVGLLSGLVTANLMAAAVPKEMMNLDPKVYNAVYLSLHIFLGYFGLVVALRYSSRLDFSGSKLITYDDEDLTNCRILDTSVLIDGRIADVVRSGFLEGTLVIPQFVLQELQGIADSSDPLKRKRGRRGLDVVRRLQSENVPVVIDERSFGKDLPVDNQLVVMAKRLRGKIISNDHNLSKVAEIHDVEVLNINDLANAMKQVVLPGEDIEVYIVKEGKEESQGVGYLDDGTMVVVDGGQSHLHEKVEATATSVLQTAAGRMIFARLKESPGVVQHPAAYQQQSEGSRPRNTRGNA